ncbi:MAG: DUF4430 domain-containing protein [Clostridium sp.]|uniref:DUF4430 domain-containing protein n=1 Tax=Clostridium sp. TaxID=1506 RepID=UPI003D6D4835
MKKLGSILLTLCLMFNMFANINVYANESDKNINVDVGVTEIKEEIKEETEKDTEKPIIKVENLINGQTVTDSNLTFKIAVTDNLDKKIISVVKFNNEVVTGTDGTYKVTLKNGENTITIEATDVAGNKADVLYKIIYEEEKETKKPEVTPDINPGGVVIPAQKSHITLSVDKLTINEGYTIQTINIELQPDDTAWTVLKRELDNRSLKCDFEWTEKYGSVYVQSIEEDGEFDHGPCSGWMYNVNGTYPNFGASKYILKDGDILQWRYTTDLGADLGEDLSKWETKDIEKPVIKVENLIDGQTVIDLNLTFKATVTDNVDKNIVSTVKFNNEVVTGTDGTYKVTLKAGENTVTIEATDAAGNKTDIIYKTIYQVPEVKDTEKPVIKVENLIDGKTVIDSNLTFKATVTDNVDKNIVSTVKFNNEVVTGTDGTYKVTLKAGENTVTIEATDAAGNKIDVIYKTIYQVPEVKDTEKPVITVENLTDEQTVTDSNLTFKIAVTDNIDKNIVPIVKFNNEVITGTDGTYKITIKDGENTITVEAVDAAENKCDKQYRLIYKAIITNPYKTQLDKNLALILKNVENPKCGTLDGEWSIISLARANYLVPHGYYEKYYNNVVEKLKEKQGVLHTKKYTEYSRVSLGLTAIGKDISDVGGYNQLEKLADFNSVIYQGINGPIFALIALDSKNYEISNPVTNIEVQTTREMLIKYILDREINKGKDNAGGWNLYGDKADIDITAMAIQALTPYYKTNDDVKTAVDRGINFLSSNQLMSGGYKAWGSESSESIAQVVIALSGLGIDPAKDAQFTKDGNSLIDTLLSYAVHDGGFKHIKTGDTDAMATDQGTLALVAYDRFVNKKNSLYNMSDVEFEKLKDIEKPVIKVENLADGQTVTDINLTFKAIVTDNVDENIVSTVKVNNEVATGTDGTYKVTLKDGENIITIEAIDAAGNKETVTYKVICKVPQSKDTEKPVINVENLTDRQTVTDSKLTFKVIVTDNVDKKIISVVRFNNEVITGTDGTYKVTLKDGENTITIGVVDAAGNKCDKQYSLIYKASTGGEGTNTGGGVLPIQKQYITLSVDKLTINEGYTIQPITIELKSGDTAWSVLKTELDKHNFKYEYEWTEKYGSIYVQSMDGDGEFDHGSGSGWMYNVNGTYPMFGASKYTLENGDVLQWRYTTNLGEDLGEDLSKWETPVIPVIPGIPGVTVIPGTPAIQITPNAGEQQSGKTLTIDVPKDIKNDCDINIKNDLKNTDNIIINVPELKSKVFLNLENVKSNIPKITAVKGNISVVVDKGTQIESGDSKIELITSVDKTDSKIQEIIKKSIDDDYKRVKLNNAFVLGNINETILFNQPVTLTFKNSKGQFVGFVEGNKFTPIKVYQSEEKGAADAKNNNKKNYAFVVGNDLIVKTNHFTTYVTYNQVKSYTYKDGNDISKDVLQQVLKATEKGFISPQNGRFDPEKYITRADFAKLLVEALNLDTKPAKKIEFEDVKIGTPYYSYYTYINAVCNSGIMKCTGNKFNPNYAITREQMASAIAKALSIKNVYTNVKINDIKYVSKAYKADIETLGTLGLIPIENNQFRPKSYATREFAVASVIRSYEYKNSKKFTNTGVENKNSKEVTNTEVKKYIDETAILMQKNITNPVVASVGGEWTVLSLARSGVSVPDSYYSKYYSNVENKLKEKNGKLHNIKYTEYDRVILALSSIGKNVDSVAKYNLLKPLVDFDTAVKQGLNGPIWALIALDCCNYEMPVDKSISNQSTREKFVNYILSRELPGGGWSLTSKAPSDIDITAMALIALSKYQDNPKVKAATDRALLYMSKTQDMDGKYKSVWGDENSSESIAQVIVALTSLKIDPKTDERFIKNGNDTISALLSFYVKGGGFKHVLSGDLDGMATDQGMYAIIAYNRFANGQTHLFDMTDVEKK